MALPEEDKIFIAENMPPPYNTPDRFGEFILPKVQMHAPLCSAAKAAVLDILSPLIRRNKHRFFCRVDDAHDLKSPAGVIEKIRRSQARSEPERYDLSNFDARMTDIARFRIVCNFLSDPYTVAEALKNAPELKSDFILKENR